MKITAYMRKDRKKREDKREEKREEKVGKSDEKKVKLALGARK